MVDLDLIESLLASQIGPDGQFSRYKKGKDDSVFSQALDAILLEAEALLGVEVVVYEVFGGAPEPFCLISDDLVVAVLSERYVELATTLSAIATNDSGNEDHVTQVCLQVMAEYLLQKGDDGFAISLFLRSLAGKEGLIAPVIAEWGLREIDDTTLENFLSSWFYGLCHELGHFWKHTDPGWQARAQELGQINARLQPIQDGAFLGFTASANFPLESISVLDTDHLIEELKADEFALRVLTQSAKRLSKVLLRDSDWFRLAVEVVLGFLHTTVIDHCKRSVRYLTTPSQDNRHSLAVASIATEIRARATLDYLVRSCRSDYGGTDEMCRERIRGLRYGMFPINVSFRNGLDRAFRIAQDPKKELLRLTKKGGERFVPWEGHRNYWTLYSLRVQLKRKKMIDPGARTVEDVSAGFFLDRAKRLCSGYYLDVLELLVKKPGTEVRTFLIPSIMTGDRSLVPLQIKYSDCSPRAVFVFFAGSARLEGFLEASLRKAYINKGGYTVVGMDCPVGWEWVVAKRIRERIGENSMGDVFFEGTTNFTMAMSKMLDSPYIPQLWEHWKSWWRVKQKSWQVRSILRTHAQE